MRKYVDSSHGAAHALGHIDKRAVGEHRGIQRGVEVVRDGYHAAQVLLDELRVRAHGLGERAEDDSRGGEPLLERRRDRDAVENRIDCDAGEPCPLVQRHTELRVRLQQLRIDVRQALGTIGVGLRGGVVRDPLIVDGRIPCMGPVRFAQREPVTQGLQPPLQQEIRLALLARDQPYDVLIQARGHGFGLDIGDKAVLVLAADQLFQIGGRLSHGAQRI